MNTPSHLILTAAVRKASPTWRMPASAVLIGSVAPDIPLTVVSFGAFGYFRYVQGWSARDALEHMYGTLYFSDPGWIASHNALHAPLMILFCLAMCRWRYGKPGFAAGWWTWFYTSCLLHSVIDVFTHFDDGPLILFPFEWSIRFPSPVSYWDAAHYGTQFFAFELALDFVLLTYLLGPRVFARLRAQRETA